MIENAEAAGTGEKVDFHYKKGEHYRTVHVDGAVGGPTPRQYLAITFYSERIALPRRSSRPILAKDGIGMMLGPEEVEESLTGVVRELEVTTLLDLNAARELLGWLAQHVATLEQANSANAGERVDGVLPENNQ